MKPRTSYIISMLVITSILTLGLFTYAHGRNTNGAPNGFPPSIFTDTIPYPIYDRYGDPFTYPNRNSFDLKDSSFIKRRIEYDPVTKEYYIMEKIGSRYYRTPMTFSMNEFLELKGRQDEVEYFRKRAGLLSDLNRRLYKPKFSFRNDWVNRIMGVGKVEIKPNGYVDIMAGYQGQNIKNPTLPERARKNGGFDFNMNSQLQVDANIGDKLKSWVAVPPCNPNDCL